MPTQTRAERLTIAATAERQKGIEDSLSDPHVVIQLLRRKNRMRFNRSGSSFDWKIATARGTVDEMSAEARADFVAVNPGVNMTLTNDGYKTADQIHEIDIKEASGAQQIFDLVEERTAWMPEHVGRAFCTDFYLDGTSTTFGTNPITGCAGAIISTGSYAGQNVGTETALAGQVLSGGVHGTFSTDPFPSLTAAILAGYRGSDKGAGEYKPDVVLMDVTNFGYVLNAANDLRKSIRHETDMDLGTEKISYMGCELIMDRLAVASRLFVLNTKYIEVHSPYGTFYVTKRKEEISPVCVNMLCFFYGKLVFKLLRPHVRVTTA